MSSVYSVKVTRLCDLSNDGNTVTSVSWSERGHQLAVGTHHGNRKIIIFARKLTNSYFN